MKKREQKSIMIGFILSIFIFLISLIILLNNIYPEIEKINSKKTDLNANLKKYNTFIKAGVNFNDFKELNNKYSNSKDVEIKKLLEGNFYKKIFPRINKDSYNKYIRKIGKKSFLESLDITSEKLKQQKDSLDFINKKNKLKNVLPIYYNISEANKGLTDSSFINYVEKILNKYELMTISPIGIKKIKQIKNNFSDNDTDIYYIPLKLKVKGTKESIINFSQYIKNTGDIIFKDNDFNFSDKVGANSQVSEIYGFGLVDYIDGSHKERNIYNKDLLQYLKNTNQNEDIITVVLDLRFYIKTLSEKNIIEKINNIIGDKNKKIILSKDSDNKEVKYELLHYNYNNLLKVSKALRINPILNKNKYYKQKAENIFGYLNNKNLKKQIQTIKKEMNKTKNIKQVYKKTLKYKDIFLKLDAEIYNIAKNLKIDKNKIDEKTKKIIQKGIYPNNYIFKN